MTNLHFFLGLRFIEIFQFLVGGAQTVTQFSELNAVGLTNVFQNHILRGFPRG